MKASNRPSPRAEASHSDLSILCRQLDDWRKSQPGRPRLPAEVWEEAAALARTHGISRVSRTLRLSFHKLRQLVDPSAAAVAGAPAPAAFIELPPLTGPGPNGCGCIVELCDGDLAKMTVRLAGESPALLELAAAFWRRGR
jgi:hypothetical protein